MKRKYCKTYRFDGTPYLHPYQKKHVHRPVVLTLSEHTYPPGELKVRSWIPSAFKAFSKLAETIPVRDLLIVGTGNGLDALGAIEIFDLNSIVATDLFEESLATSRKNILSNLEVGTSINISFHAGDLLTCVPPEKRFCLVYENLPNLPASEEIDTGAGINSASFFDADQHTVPEMFDTYLLALHYLCLWQAHGRVRPGGGVLTSIGGRVPLEVAFSLHRACGYSPTLVVFDMKIQSEPESVIPGYCKAEEQKGIEFRFYAPDVLKVVEACQLSGLEGEALADAVKDDLDRYAVSAREAMNCFRQGKEVAHSVFMVFGELIPSQELCMHKN